MRIFKNRIILSRNETKRWYGQDLHGHELPGGADGKLHALGRYMAQKLANHLRKETFIFPFDYKSSPNEGPLDSFNPQG